MRTYTQTPPTWLSGMIEMARKHPRRFMQVRELVRLLGDDPRGQAILGHSGFRAAIHDGLDAADEREHELEQNPDLMTASPSHEAAQVIADRLGISLK